MYSVPSAAEGGRNSRVDTISGMGNLVGQWGIMRFNVPGNQKSQAFLTVKMIGFVGNPFGRVLAIITGYFPVLEHRELNWCHLNWVNPRKHGTKSLSREGESHEVNNTKMPFTEMSGKKDYR